MGGGHRKRKGGDGEEEREANARRVECCERPLAFADGFRTDPPAETVQ